MKWFFELILIINDFDIALSDVKDFNVLNNYYLWYWFDQIKRNYNQYKL